MTSGQEDHVGKTEAKQQWIVRLMDISRLAWDLVVVPTVLDPIRRRDLPTAEDCVWLMGLADALFPLVPRACRALMGITVSAYAEHSVAVPRENGRVFRLSKIASRKTSWYFALKCAGVAGSARCIKWIVGRKATRNSRKECLAVLRGLCYGGHLGMARELVDSCDTNWRGALKWPASDPDLIYDIRDVSEGHPSLLHDACEGGHLDVINWVMSKFGVGHESWELAGPFRAALRRGHLDVARWLVACPTGVVPSCRPGMCQWFGTFRSQPEFTTPYYPCAPEAFVEIFAEFCKVGSRESEVFAKCIHCCDNFEEACEQLFTGPAQNYGIWIPRFESIESSKGLKWVLNKFYVHQPPANVFWTGKVQSQDELLSHACNTIADVKLLEWIFTQFTFESVTSGDVIGACGNKKDSVEVVKMLLENAGALPTQEEFQDCMALCLANNNTAIAEWLESTFHVMDGVNSDPRKTERIFGTSSRSSGIEGVQWFLSRAKVCNISEKAVVSAIKESCCLTVKLFLLKQFNVRVSEKSSSLLRRLVEDGDVSQVEEARKYCDFSSSDIQEALAGCKKVQSGKVVKGLLGQFMLSEGQPKIKYGLLSLLIKHHKVGCVEWFLHKFPVPLHEFITRMKASDNTVPITVTVGMWKMMMRVLPLSVSYVKWYLMGWATCTPLHTTLTMKTVGLTMANILSYEETIKTSYPHQHHTASPKLSESLDESAV
ncbi:hypothetical protein Pelo_10618 [Pelomyxa schiedti]|nr:hypothetical protein Pelo_10618 [Pelomyxa schiedti]